MPANDRLRDAAHYIIARIPPSKLGAVKLNKVLWFADCAYFTRHGRSITGVEVYTRRKFGPCPPQIGDALAELKRTNKIVETSVQVYLDSAMREFTSLVEPNISIFSGEEIDLLLQIGTQIAQLTSTEASNVSHDALWEETLEHGAMSVAAGAARPDELNETDLDWARAAFT